jgi:hypothetical protein
MVIIVTILFAFGVASQSMLHKNNENSYKTIFGIFEKTYWPIYGEISFLHSLNPENCDQKDPKKSCLDTVTYITYYLLLMVYMIIASVLLLNLLIALFT